MNTQQPPPGPNPRAEGIPDDSEGRQSGFQTGVAAATYTAVAATQKASGFLLLIAFTRVLSPSDYGQIALLTTVSGLLLMTMTFGLEPRIMYAYFRVADGLAAYLRTAHRVSILGPVAVAVALSCTVLVLPLGDPSLWIMESVGACLTAAGTTYPYAILRSSRRAGPYAALALGILATQVVGRVTFVTVLGWGPRGWATSDLVTGAVSLLAGLLLARAPRSRPGDNSPSTWSVVREGLPLVPHYLAQWGLSLSDRLVLVAFVSTAAIGVYSAIYQIAAVISMMLSEVNRAFMPLYARQRPGSLRLAPLVRLHLRITFVLFGVMFLVGLAGVTWFLPHEYSEHDSLYPALAFGALLYGLYFIPMNGLTLVAGVTNKAPLISLSALSANLIANVALDGLLGLWGAVLATALGYLGLGVFALAFSRGERAIPWAQVAGKQPLTVSACGAIAVLTLLITLSGPVRLGCVLALASVVVVLAATLRAELKAPATSAVTFRALAAGARPSALRPRGECRDVGGSDSRDRAP